MKDALLYIFGTLLFTQALLGLAIATDHAAISAKTLTVATMPQVVQVSNPYTVGRE